MGRGSYRLRRGAGRGGGGVRGTRVIGGVGGARG